MKTIPLTNSDQIALVDDSDYEMLIQFKWRLHSKGYAVRGCMHNGKYQTIYMHYAIMHMKGIDHKDRNKLNNQRVNLRSATQSQNNANFGSVAHKTHITTGKYKGVYWHKQNNIWCAQIGYQKRIFYLGSFNTEIDAAKAYNAKALELFREFARLNEVE